MLDQPLAMWVALVVFVALSGCQSDRAKSSSNASSKTPAASTTPRKDVPEAKHLEALRVIRAQPMSWGTFFNTSQSCGFCHSNHRDAQAMRDAKGRPVAPFDTWQASMMANASRDPFWRAAVAKEIAATPSRRDDIEATCMRCHAPMASVEARQGQGPPARTKLLSQASLHGQLAVDGVSCALCHQIQPDRLGTPASFSGDYVVTDARVVFGPYDDPWAQPMVEQANYQVQQGKHLQSPGLCGSCHTLFTDILDADGEAHGLFAEQTPYLEWRNSIFNTEREDPAPEAQTCQGCHMPRRDVEGQTISTRIARDPLGSDFAELSPRTPYARHLFVGGNTLIPALLRDYPDVFNALASREAFDAVIALARQQLQERTARVTLAEVRRDAEMLVFDVRVTNLTGHKFPTGHPSRRAWLRGVVRDNKGALVLASGRVDEAGYLVDMQGQRLPTEAVGGPIMPHVQKIERSDQVQLYEPVMADLQGTPTYTLLRGASYAKDNRLLPRGWRSEASLVEHIAPVGVDEDGDFGAGGDVTTYAVRAPAGEGPVEVEVSLLYQPLGGRYAAELFAFEAPEIDAFEALIAPRGLTVELVSQVTRRVP